MKNGHVVVDAPVVLPEGEEDEEDIEGENNDDQKALRFMKEAKYVLCPGVSGYIQTNRESGGYDGGEHTVGDNPDWKDTQIMTYVMVESGDPESCVEDGNNYVNINNQITIEYFKEINN